MRLLGIVAVALAAGCAQSPQEVRESGVRLERRSSQEPKAVAHCITRRAEAMTFGAGLRPTVALREAAGTGAYEVIVSGAMDVHGALGVALVTPDSKGSRITVWRSQSLLLGSGQVETMADGC